MIGPLEQFAQLLPLERTQSKVKLKFCLHILLRPVRAIRKSTSRRSIPELPVRAAFPCRHLQLQHHLAKARSTPMPTGTAARAGRGKRRAHVHSRATRDACVSAHAIRFSTEHNVQICNCTRTDTSINNHKQCITSLHFTHANMSMLYSIMYTCTANKYTRLLYSILTSYGVHIWYEYVCASMLSS